MDNVAVLAASPEGAPTGQEVAIVCEPRVVCIPCSYSQVYFQSMCNVGVTNF
jgi:hypothetical protein